MLPKFWTISQNNLIKKTGSKWPNQNGCVQYNLSKITSNQIEHLSLFSCFLLVFQIKKTMNFSSD
jgi:hypothetical protein